MTPLIERHLALLALRQPLLRYASLVQSDINASFFLVHRALSLAFAEPHNAMRPLPGLEVSLRADIDSFRLADAAA